MENCRVYFGLLVVSCFGCFLVFGTPATTVTTTEEEATTTTLVEDDDILSENETMLRFNASIFTQYDILHTPPEEPLEDGETCKYNEDCISGCCVNIQGTGRVCSPKGTVGQSCTEEELKGGYHDGACPCVEEYRCRRRGRQLMGTCTQRRGRSMLRSGSGNVKI